MARSTLPVTVKANEATLLTAKGETDSRQGQTCTYYNAGSVTVWLGSQGVSVGNGIPLLPGEKMSEDLDNDNCWGIATAACQVNVDQVGI